MNSFVDQHPNESRLRGSIDALQRGQLPVAEWRQRVLPPPQLELYIEGHAIYDPIHDSPPRPFRPFRLIGLEASDDHAAHVARKVAHNRVLI